MEATKDIFFVDDEKMMREMIMKAFAKEDLRVHCFENAHTVLGFLNEGYIPPDLVITDLMMPEMDGVKFLTELNTICPDARSLVFSGKNSRWDINKVLQLGCSGFISKDVGLGELVKRSKTIIESEDVNQGWINQASTYTAKEEVTLGAIEFDEDYLLIPISVDVPLGSILEIEITPGKKAYIEVLELRGSLGEYKVLAREITRSYLSYGLSLLVL